MTVHTASKLVMKNYNYLRMSGHVLSSEASRDAVLESLGTLGESQRQAIVFMLKRDYKVDLRGPISDLESVFHGLKGLFGQGAPLLIDLIKRNLASRMTARESVI